LPHIKPYFIPTLFKYPKKMHDHMCMLKNHLHPCNNTMNMLIWAIVPMLSTLPAETKHLR
jgi:hypothetical protein